jgi:hypothetical protein
MITAAGIQSATKAPHMSQATDFATARTKRLFTL